MVGIETVDQLEKVGAVGAYLLLKDAFPNWASLNDLWGLQSALMDIDWRELPEELKNKLWTEVENSGWVTHIRIAQSATVPQIRKNLFNSMEREL